MSQVWESAELMAVTGKRGKTPSTTKIAVDYTLRCDLIGRNGVNSWLPFIESKYGTKKSRELSNHNQKYKM